MSERIYAAELADAVEAGGVGERGGASSEGSARLILDGAEAHHLARVLRARQGTRVVVFDGRGLERLAEVERVGKREVELRLVDGPVPGRSPRARLGIAVAPPKGKRMRWLVEKATELGAAAIVPLLAERGVVDPEARADHKQGKWRQATIEAAKQCGVLVLPEIAEPEPLAAAVRRQVRLTVLLDPEGEVELAAAVGGLATASGAKTAAIAPEAAAAGLDVLALIGPEGGFTEAEVAAARAAGAVPVRLGPTVLRVETAALAALAVARALLG